MNKKLVISFILVFSILLSILVPSVSAQQNTYTSPLTDRAFSEGVNFDWRWILLVPLLAIPLLMLATHKSRRERYYEDRRNYIGTKGGRSSVKSRRATHTPEGHPLKPQP